TSDGDQDFERGRSTAAKRAQILVTSFNCVKGTSGEWANSLSNDWKAASIAAMVSFLNSAVLYSKKPAAAGVATSSSDRSNFEVPLSIHSGAETHRSFSRSVGTGSLIARKFT